MMSGECERVDLVVTGATELSVEQAMVSRNRDMTMSLQKVFREAELPADASWRDRLVITAESLFPCARSAVPRNSHSTFMFRK